MFSARPPVITALIPLGLLAAVFWALQTFPTARPVSRTVNDPSDANTIWRADVPLSLAEAAARGKCSIPLPQEATRIQYVDFYDYGFMHWVRFEAPVPVCQAHAVHVIQAFNATRKNLEPLPVQARPLDPTTAASMARFVCEQSAVAARAAWFVPDTVVQGEMWGGLGSHLPCIVIDTDKGVFYYLRTD